MRCVFQACRVDRSRCRICSSGFADGRSRRHACCLCPPYSARRRTTTLSIRSTARDLCGSNARPRVHHDTARNVRVGNAGNLSADAIRANQRFIKRPQIDAASCLARCLRIVSRNDGAEENRRDARASRKSDRVHDSNPSRCSRCGQRPAGAAFLTTWRNAHVYIRFEESASHEGISGCSEATRRR